MRSLPTRGRRWRDTPGRGAQDDAAAEATTLRPGGAGSRICRRRWQDRGTCIQPGIWGVARFGSLVSNRGDVSMRMDLVDWALYAFIVALLAWAAFGGVLRRLIG